MAKATSSSFYGTERMHIQSYGSTCVLKRKLLQQSLEARQRTRGLGEIFCELIENATKQAHITFKKAPDFVVSCVSFDFIRANLKSFDQTPFYYSPPVHLQFQNLVDEIHTRTQENLAADSSSSEARSISMIDAAPMWDMSVSNLVLGLDNVAADENWKETMKQRVSYLQQLAAIPPHPSAILHTAMYKTLAKIMTQIDEAMEKRNGSDIIEESSTVEVETTSNSDADSVTDGSPSSVGQVDSVKSVMTIPPKQAFVKANVGQVDSVESSGSSPSKQVSAYANVGQVNSVRSMENHFSAYASVGQVNSVKSAGSDDPSKQVLADVNIRQADSVRRLGSNPSTELANVKDGQALKFPDGGNPEEALHGEVEETIITCEDRVRMLLLRGVIEEFFNEVEGALAKLVPVVEKKIECCMVDGDEDSASWLSLWLTRLLYDLGH